MRTLLLFAVLLLFFACDASAFVDRVVIANDSAYPANVAVRGQSGGWMPVATVSSGQTRSVEEVIDQGESWTFRFAYAGHEVEVEVSREELVRREWRVEVPDELEQRLRADDVSAPP